MRNLNALGANLYFIRRGTGEVNKQAIIIIHEIYGINQFIKNVCEKIRLAEYDIYCPNLIGKNNFAYFCKGRIF